MKLHILNFSKPESSFSEITSSELLIQNKRFEQNVSKLVSDSAYHRHCGSVSPPYWPGQLFVRTKKTGREKICLIRVLLGAAKTAAQSKADTGELLFTSKTVDSGCIRSFLH